MLDQDPRYYGWMTGRELVELAGRLQGLSERDGRSRATTTLELVGLADAARRRVGGYSGGMRQRLGIAQALVASPRLLILDEPVSSLDPEGRRDLLALIADLRASATVIFSTHVLADVERICDRVGIMDRGRLVTEGPLDELLARYALPLFRIEAEPGQADGARSPGRDACARPPGSMASTDDGPGRLVVSVTDEGAASAGLLPLVVAAGLRLAAFERARPTLEDVFLRLVGRDPGEAPATARRARGVSATAILVRKELLESWRTYRLPVVAGLFLLVGLTSPLLARFLPEIIKAAGGDQLGNVQVPTPIDGRRGRPAVEEPRPVRGVRGDHPGDGRGGHRTGSRHGRLHPVQDRPRGARSWAPRRSPSARCWPSPSSSPSAVGWIYTAILFEPMPVGGWIALAILAWLGLARLGGHHVPRQHRDRIRRGGGRPRVPRPARAVDRGRDPERRALPAGRAGRARARPGDRARRSRSRTW